MCQHGSYRSTEPLLGLSVHIKIVLHSVRLCLVLFLFTGQKSLVEKSSEKNEETRGWK